MRYGRFIFRSELQAEALLPPFKGSTFRGAFGTALKRVVCALKRQECQKCLLADRCIYNVLFENDKAKKPNPISCLKIRTLIPEITASVQCSCIFDLRGGKYPSPFLHIEPDTPLCVSEGPLIGSSLKDTAKKYFLLLAKREEIDRAFTCRNFTAGDQKRKSNNYGGTVKMSIVYLVDQGAFISKEGQRLLVKKLLKEGIDTAFMTFRGKYLGRLQPPEGKNILLRKTQYERFQDESFALETAKAIVCGKLANQRSVLMRLNRNRKGANLEELIFQMKKIIDKAHKASSMETLRGFEGKGSAIYFQGFSKGFLDANITFTSRIRRPPTDPVNALLSLGYTLLFNTLLATAHMVGLDPYLGMLHTTDYGRPSLALDLMEEWRPILIDTLVLSVFNLKSIVPADFITDKKLCLEKTTDQDIDQTEDCVPSTLPVCLTDSGFRKYLTQFERKMAQTIRFHLTGHEISYRDAIHEQARHFVRYLKDEDNHYIPVPYR